MVYLHKQWIIESKMKQNKHTSQVQSLNKRTKRGLKMIVTTLSLQKYQVRSQMPTFMECIAPVASKIQSIPKHSCFDTL